MRFDSARVLDGSLECFTLRVVECTVSPRENGSPLALRPSAEAVDIAGDFDLLLQRQGLHSANDGFENGHNGERSKQRETENASMIIALSSLERRSLSSIVCRCVNRDPAQWGSGLTGQ
jgi:hypothetical protein